jgi:tetratricopeptide (TPR) repeat protein
MSDKQLRELLQDADRAAGPPRFAPLSAADCRRRIHRRKVVWLAVPAAAAAILLFGLGLWGPRFHAPTPAPQQDGTIASLQEQVKQLQAQTDSALRLVHEVLAQDRRRQEQAALDTELASIPNAAEEIEQQVDKTAFVLVYEADKLYHELNQTESAVEAYEQVIRLFPNNRWAHVARERLAKIKKQRINKSKTEGDAECAPQNV